MKKIYYANCDEYRKSRISYLLGKTLVLSAICSKCKNEDEKMIIEKESTEISKVLSLIENMWWL